MQFEHRHPVDEVTDAVFRGQGVVVRAFRMPHMTPSRVARRSATTDLGARTARHLEKLRLGRARRGRVPQRGRPVGRRRACISDGCTACSWARIQIPGPTGTGTEKPQRQDEPASRHRFRHPGCWDAKATDGPLTRMKSCADCATVFALPVGREAGALRTQTGTKNPVRALATPPPREGPAPVNPEHESRSLRNTGHLQVHGSDSTPSAGGAPAPRSQNVQPGESTWRH